MSTLDRVVSVLKRHRFNFTTEDELQRGIASALREAGESFEREVPLTKADRIDFLVGVREGDDFRSEVGIEVKVDGSISALTRQVYRYADHPRVPAVLIVTGLHRHDNMPPVMNGKPVRVLVVSRAFA